MRFQVLPLLMLLMLHCGKEPSQETAKAQPGSTPQAQPPKPLVFEEDLRFGSNSGEGHFFWAGENVRLSPASDGRMVISDLRENRVLAFDQSGQFLAMVGRKGQGPGEFQGLQQFQVLQDGSALALELVGATYPKRHVFDNQWKPMDAVQQKGLPSIIQAAQISPNGGAIAAFFVKPNPTEMQLQYRHSILNDQFEEIQNFKTDSGPLPDRSRFDQPGYWTERIAQNLTRFLAGQTVFGFDQAGHIYTADSQKYEITKWSADLKEPLMTFKSNFKPLPLSEKEQEILTEFILDQLRTDPDLAQLITSSVVAGALAQVSFPLIKQPIFALIPIEDKGLLVVRDVNLVTGQNSADIFDSQGTFLGQVQMGQYAFASLTQGGYLPRMTFANGYAYTIETNAQGDHQAVRYRYQMPQ